VRLKELLERQQAVRLWELRGRGEVPVAPRAERVEVRLLELPEERKAVRLWELLSEPGLDSEQ